MPKARLGRMSFLYSAHIIGWILASLSAYTIAFLSCNSLTSRISSMPSPSSTVDVSATATSENSIPKSALPEKSGSNQSRIYSYESPFFPISNGGQHIPSALIILNTPIKSSTEKNGRLSGVLGVLWETSSYRICADGGANRLYDAITATRGIGSEETDSSAYLPDLITGDLDSVRPDVRQYYEERGVAIVRVEDQNFHDLDKSLMAVEKWAEKSIPENKSSTEDEEGGSNKKNITANAFIYGGFGGRFDQEMGCINALCVWGKKESFQQITLALYDEETCAFALPELPMKSEIRIRFPGESIGSDKQTDKVGEGPTCGLIPIVGGCDNVKTTGLKWNLEGDVPLEFGGLVSSSNRVVDKVVTVESSSPLLFTAEMIVKQK